MRCTSRFGRTAMVVMLLALAIGGLSLLAAGCNDNSEQEMYKQMMAGGANSGDQPARQTGQAATPNGQAVAGAASPDQQTEDTEAVPQEPIDNVIVESVEVKAPYPEFDGEGRYDVRVSVLLKDFEDAQVYRIAALDADGNEVGSQEKHLKLPMKKARTFDFNEFYCTHMPASVAFYRTDKTAIAANEDQEEQATPPGSGRGIAGGGSGDDDDNEQSIGRGVAGGD